MKFLIKEKRKKAGILLSKAVNHLSPLKIKKISSFTFFLICSLDIGSSKISIISQRNVSSQLEKDNVYRLESLLHFIITGIKLTLTGVHLGPSFAWKQRKLVGKEKETHDLCSIFQKYCTLMWGGGCEGAMKVHHTQHWKNIWRCVHKIAKQSDKSSF